MVAPRPYTLVAELTYRCPLRCPYCSNPIDLQLKKGELSTEQWCRVFSDAAELGVVQLHLSGGEPTVRKDLPALIRHARQCDLYTNLITGGTLLTEDDLREFVLRALAESKNLQFRRSLLGSPVSVVTIDDGMTALSSNYVRVTLARARMPNQIETITAASLSRQGIVEAGALPILS